MQDDNPTIKALKEKRANLLPLLHQESEHLLGVKFAEVATQLQTLEVQSQELAKIGRNLAKRRN